MSLGQTIAQLQAQIAQTQAQKARVAAQVTALSSGSPMPASPPPLVTTFAATADAPYTLPSPAAPTFAPPPPAGGTLSSVVKVVAAAGAIGGGVWYWRRRKGRRPNPKKVVTDAVKRYWPWALVAGAGGYYLYQRTQAPAPVNVLFLPGAPAQGTSQRDALYQAAAAQTQALGPWAPGAPTPTLTPMVAPPTPTQTQTAYNPATNSFSLIPAGMMFDPQGNIVPSQQAQVQT